MDHRLSTITLPIQAGGGLPSAVSSISDVQHLSANILSHLKTIYESEVQQGPSDQQREDYESRHDLPSRQAAVKRSFWDVQGEQSPPYPSSSSLSLSIGSPTQSASANPNAETGGTTMDTFLRYVTSPSFSALRPCPANDLTHPISNYFISSSHNTYLTGHQLFGQSSVTGYVNVSDE